jgi:nuclear transport factor 2 (NTF2) superfamily protein
MLPPVALDLASHTDSNLAFARATNAETAHQWDEFTIAYTCDDAVRNTARRVTEQGREQICGWLQQTLWR